MIQQLTEALNMKSSQRRHLIQLIRRAETLKVRLPSILAMETKDLQCQVRLGKHKIEERRIKTVLKTAIREDCSMMPGYVTLLRRVLIWYLTLNTEQQQLLWSLFPEADMGLIWALVS